MSAPFTLWRIAVPAFAPSLLFGIAMGAIMPIVPLDSDRLGASLATAAMLVGLFGIGSLVANIPASLITARWGERWAIVGASVWGGLSMALCALTDRLDLFAAGCFMIGMAQAVFSLARQSYLGEVVPIEYRARAMSMLGGVMRLGTFAGPVIAAGAMHFFGLHAAYAVGIGALLCAAVLALRIPDLEVPSSGGVRAQVSILSVLREHRRIFSTLGIGVLLLSAVRASRQAIIPLWSVHLGLEPSVASLIYGLSAGIEMLVFYPAGKVMDVKGRRWVAVPSLLLMAAALLWMPWTSGPWGLLAAALLVGLGNGIGSGIVMTLGADHSPRHGRAQFLGVWRLMSDGGSSGGPALLALLAATLSLSAAISVTGGLGLAAAVALGYWIPSQRPERQG